MNTFSPLIGPLSQRALDFARIPQSVCLAALLLLASCTRSCSCSPDSRATGWSEATSISPPPRTHHAASREQGTSILLFGGYGDDGLLGDTWQLQGGLQGGEWKRLLAQSDCKKDACPAPRYGHAMAYDVQRNRVVLFGGYGTNGVLGDTWEWDGKNWFQTPSKGSKPPPSRYRHAMTYSPKMHAVVMFGGEGDGQVGFLDDGWTWDGQQWAPLPRAHSAQPSPRADAALSTVVTNGQEVVLLFGGMGPDGQRLGDTWLWNGQSWKQAASAESPYARAGHALASASRLYLLGGDGIQGPLANLWAWSEAGWTLVSASSNLGVRSGHSLVGVAGDMAGNGSTLTAFGGFGNGRRLGDTWTRTSDRWERLPSETMPPARAMHGGAYDGSRGEVVVFGGFGAAGALSDTWTRKGSVWTAHPPGPGPSARGDHALATDSRDGVVRLFGGSGPGDAGSGRALGDFWEWDGIRWSEVKLPATEAKGNPQASPHPWPQERYAHAMAYDPVSGTTMIFGGSSSSGTATRDVWQWHSAGKTWSSPANSTNGAPPEARFGHAMVFDQARQVIVLFGGANAGGRFGDTWIWNGKNGLWTKVQLNEKDATPSPRQGHQMSYDNKRNRVILYGGLGDKGELSDTWVWDGKIWNQVKPADEGAHPPPPRRDAILAYDEDQQSFVLFGGRGTSLFGDTWTLNLR